MEKVISRESVRRAANKVAAGRVQNITRDSKNIYAEYKTSFGTYNITLSRDKIRQEANSAFARIFK